jgi:hypothetical protein
MRANAFISINDVLINKLKILHGERKYLNIPNGFSSLDLERSKAAATIRSTEKFHIVYTGSIVQGLHVTEPFWEAVHDLFREGLITSSNLLISIYGNNNDFSQFLGANELLDAGILKFVPAIPRSEIFSIQKSCDMLLFFGVKSDDTSDIADGVVSGKIFELTISGTEIFAVGVDENAVVSEIIQKSNTGSIYGMDADRIKNRILSGIEGRRGRVEPNFQYLQRFNRERHAQQILDFVENNVG